MKIYTKSGDDGKTGLFRGPRVSKDDPRIEAFGTVDELSSAIGVARAAGLPLEIDTVLERVQHQLFSLGAQLATPEPDALHVPLIAGKTVAWVEERIDHFDGQLSPLKNFILPAGTVAAVALHHARVVCRRAERRVVTLANFSRLPSEALIYLNRIGDLLFVLARYANSVANQDDVLWQQDT